MSEKTIDEAAALVVAGLEQVDLADGWGLSTLTTKRVRILDRTWTMCVESDSTAASVAEYDEPGDDAESYLALFGDTPALRAMIHWERFASMRASRRNFGQVSVKALASELEGFDVPNELWQRYADAEAAMGAAVDEMLEIQDPGYHGRSLAEHRHMRGLEP